MILDKQDVFTGMTETCVRVLPSILCERKRGARERRICPPRTASTGRVSMGRKDQFIPWKKQFFANVIKKKEIVRVVYVFFDYSLSKEDEEKGVE